MYEIRFTTAAEKYFKKLKDNALKHKYEIALLAISKDPYIGELKVGDLAGCYCYPIFYNRTKYDIAYKVYEQDTKLIVVILAGTRQNFYAELKRYYPKV